MPDDQHACLCAKSNNELPRNAQVIGSLRAMSPAELDALYDRAKAFLIQIKNALPFGEKRDAFTISLRGLIETYEIAESNLGDKPTIRHLTEPSSTIVLTPLVERRRGFLWSFRKARRRRARKYI